MFLFEFRVYWKNVVWPTRYGFMAEDFNMADEMFINQIKIDSDDGTFKVERVVFIE